MSYARHLDPRRFQKPGNVHSRGFAFDVGIGGDDEFFDVALLDAFYELFYIELFRARAFVRLDGAAEDVIEAVESFGVLDDRDIDRFFDDADGAAVALRIGAEFAEILFGNVEAVLADPGAAFEFGNRIGKQLRIRFRPPEQMEPTSGWSRRVVSYTVPV